ncbi:PREDICTED: uncharacterized protein LOC109589267 [Amphimedon queenslandica]|uniref:Transmembrane protein n=1 Tax=Amphimedon queenslandica TaxID=400682 RepID=A0AAN0JV38_AMPQE|nr:PREDICTED: uncharacterized protein LOC109589267 [Amphimedon queenslandica]|eukprot:XP_019860930.1 PREDICTED: uncharacterized protein LOC109589267 [Amphimedon queenslandica]
MASYLMTPLSLLVVSVSLFFIVEVVDCKGPIKYKTALNGTFLVWKDDICFRNETFLSRYIDTSPPPQCNLPPLSDEGSLSSKFNESQQLQRSNSLSFIILPPDLQLDPFVMLT